MPRSRLDPRDIAMRMIHLLPSVSSESNLGSKHVITITTTIRKRIVDT